MSNPFKKIASDEKAPEELKAKVLKSADNAKMLMDMAELFSTKYLESMADMFRAGSKEDEDDEENEDQTDR